MATYPEGSIIIPGDQDATACVFDQNGLTLATPTLTRCEMGDIVPSGIMALGKIQDPSSRMVNVDLWSTDSALIASVAMTSIFGSGHPFDGFAPIRGNVDRVYVAGNKIGDGLAARTVKTVDLTGAIGATTWTLGEWTFGTQIRSMAVNRENTRLYYSVQQSNSPILAHDLVNDLDLGIFIAEDAGGLSTGLDIFVLDNGDLLVSYGFASADTQFETRRFNSSGVLQDTYALIANAGTASPVFLCPEWGHDDVFWSRSFTDGGGVTARYDQWSIASATITDTFDKDTVEGSGDVPLSCPMLVVPFAAVAEGGVIGPLVWVRVPRRQPDGTIVYAYWSDIDMQCPGEWYGGFKDGRVTRFG